MKIRNCAKVLLRLFGEKLKMRESYLTLLCTGEGLFTRRDVAAGDLLALYNGVRMSSVQARKAATTHPHEFIVGLNNMCN